MTPATTADQGPVHVVDDDEPVRESLQLLLGLRGFATEGYASADAFLAAATPQTGGCLLLDLKMPGIGGLELQALLKQRGITLPVIVVTGHGDVAAARTAFLEGAVDFLEKPVDEPVLLSAIRTALAIDRDRRTADAAAASLEALLARLSSREREVMWLVAEGHPNRDIGTMLGISPRTVEIYKARMLDKLQLRGLAGLLHVLADVPRDQRRSSP